MPRTGKEINYPDVVNAVTIDENAFVDFVCVNRKLERAQVKAVMDGVSSTLGDLLRLGHSVKLDGIGSFSVDVKGRLEADKRGVLQLKGASVKSVKVRPSKKLMKELGECKFTLLSHQSFSPQKIDTDKAKELALFLLERKPFFTTTDFAEAMEATPNCVLKRLHEMEAARILQSTRVGHGYAWTKADLPPKEADADAVQL